MKKIFKIIAVILSLSSPFIASAAQGDIYYGSTTYPFTVALPIGGSATCMTSNGSTPMWGSCGAGGGSGGGTFSTTTYHGSLLQYPYTTLITSLNGSATTSSGWWYDPFHNTAYIGASTTIAGNLTVPSIVATTTATSSFAGGISSPCFSTSGGPCLTQGGAVSSVSNSDGSLIISPTTGSVVASLNPVNPAASSTFQGNLNVAENLSAATGTYAQIIATDFTGTGLTVGCPLTYNSFHGFGFISSASCPLGISYGGTGVAGFNNGWVYAPSSTTPLTSSTSPTVNYITATSTTATSSFAGVVDFGGGDADITPGGSGGQLVVPNASTTNLTVSSLTAGDCVQAGAGGVLLSAASACGSGGGGTNYLTNSGSNTYLNTGTALQAPNVQGTSTSGNDIFASSVGVGATSTTPVPAQLTVLGSNSNGYQEYITTQAGWKTGESVGIAFGDTSGGSSLLVPYATSSLWTSFFGIGFKEGETGHINMAVGTDGSDDVGLGGTITESNLSGSTLVALGNGKVGVGTTSPSATFAVNGTSFLGGNLTLSSVTGTQCLHAVNGVVSGTGSDCGSGGGGSGVAYPFGGAGNSTSTLTQFNAGLTSYASTTVGNGAAAGGLTVSGNATTTGALAVGGTGTSTVAGPLYVGTSTPTAAYAASNSGLVGFSDGTAAIATTSKPSSYVFTVASSTNNGSNLLTVDSNGHLLAGGASTTVSGGTSSLVYPSNDGAGTISVAGTALTSVTLTFAAAWSGTPVCTESDNVLVTASDISSVSSTSVTFGFGTGGVSSATIWYRCVQPTH